MIARRVGKGAFKGAGLSAHERRSAVPTVDVRGGHGAQARAFAHSTTGVAYREQTIAT